MIITVPALFSIILGIITLAFAIYIAGKTQQSFVYEENILSDLEDSLQNQQHSLVNQEKILNYISQKLR